MAWSKQLTLEFTLLRVSECKELSIPTSQEAVYTKPYLLSANIRVSQRCPVYVSSQEHVFGEMHVPPFRHDGVQTAVKV